MPNRIVQIYLNNEPRIFSPKEFKINFQKELDFDKDHKKLYEADMEGVCLYV